MKNLANKKITLKQLREILTYDKIDCSSNFFNSMYIIEVQKRSKDYAENITIINNNLENPPGEEDVLRTTTRVYNDGTSEYVGSSIEANDNNNSADFYNSGHNIRIKNLDVIIPNEKIDIKLSASSLHQFSKETDLYGELIPKIKAEISHCNFYLENPDTMGAGSTLMVGEGVHVHLKENVIEAPFSIIFDGGAMQKVTLEHNDFNNWGLYAKIISDGITKSPNDSVVYQPNHSIFSLVVKNNKILLLGITGKMGVDFKGSNEIDKLVIDDAADPINWNPYQKISCKEDKDIETHLDLFLKLKGKAITRGDRFQELYLHREIVKCNHAKIKNEKLFKSLQDKIILGWIQYSSNYETSWSRPMILLASWNFLTALLLSWVMVADIDMFSILAWIKIVKMTLELFIPFALIGDCCNGETLSDLFGSFIIIAHKIFYAALVYNIVKTFRMYAGR
ncbi:MAG: hypothetical protein K0U41_05340 [Gammaproteobacteria bacterium]|nr:hypothetical protein [Gammaproteobacteria bacterium]